MEVRVGIYASLNVSSKVTLISSLGGFGTFRRVLFAKTDLGENGRAASAEIIQPPHPQHHAVDFLVEEGPVSPED
eukprot:1338220-Amorphochlora_amoeboformis.AAC.1